jgi:hypothetical protein
MVMRVLRTGGLKFDGVDDYVEVPHSPSQNVQKFTIIFWLYPRAWTYTNLIMKSISNSVRYFNFGIWLGTNASVYYGHGDRTNLFWRNAPANILSLNMWNHIALTYDGSTYILYINSVQKDAATTTLVPVASSADILMMTETTKTYFTNAFIDEVHIYNRALSAQEISDIYNYGAVIRDGLVLLLDFTEYEGATAYDKSGLGNHGTIYGAEWVIKKAERVLSA